MLRRVHCWICERLCGHLKAQAVNAPQPVRDASHNLANMVMRMKGASSRLREEAQELDALAATMHETPRGGNGASPF